MRSHAKVLFAVAALLSFVAFPAIAQAGKVVDSFLPLTAGSGGLGGQFDTPRDVDVNDPAITTDGSGHSGWLYVADAANNRVQAFDADKDFQWAIGADVVATGPGNGGTAEVQSLTVNASSGTFRLSFDGQSTAPIAYDASAAAVESALNALSTIGGIGGAVSVSGGPGDATGSTPYAIAFEDALGGFNVPQISLDANGLGVAAGTTLTCASSTSATTTNFQWLADGLPATGAGATTATYTVDAGDAGKALQCQVTKLNANAGATQVSNPRLVASPFPATAPPLAPSGTIAAPAGTAAAGNVLACNPNAANWSGSPTFAYRWYRNGAPLAGNGAETSEYTVQAADVATAAVFQCAVTGSNAGGSVTKVSQSRATPSAPSPAAPGGNTSSPNVSVTALSATATTSEGVPEIERCVAADGDVCKAGVTGTSLDGPGGEFSGVQAVVIDQSTGHFFTREFNNNRRIQEFDAEGTFVRAFGADVSLPAGGAAFEICTTAPSCKAGAAGTVNGPGAFGATSGSGTASASGLAISPLNGHLYAADPGNRRVMEFDPGGSLPADVFVRAWGYGVDPTNAVANQFEVCSATCQGGVNNIFEINSHGYFDSGNSPAQLAIDSRGTLYASNGSGGPGFQVLRFDTTVAGDDEGPSSAAEGMLKHGWALGYTPAALDANPDSDGIDGVDIDRLLIARSALAGIEEYDVTADPPVTGEDLLDTHMVSADLRQNGLAHNDAADAGKGEIYVTSCGTGSNSSCNAAHRLYVLDSDGNTTPPSVTIFPPSQVDADSAHLSAAIDPAGFPTSYRFQVSKDGVEWTDVTANQDIGSGTENVAVEDDAANLDANTLYRVRVLVTRGFGNGSVESAELSFATDTVAPDVVTLPDRGPSDTTVALAGTVNPHGLPTTYRFEYGPTTAYGTNAPAPGAGAGSGHSPQLVVEQVSGLTPAATYHFRLCATSSQGTQCGADRTFTTRATSAVAAGERAYELVSPPDKPTGPGLGNHTNNSQLDGEANAGAGIASLNGERFVSSSAYGGVLTEGDSAFVMDYALAERTSSGWVNRSAFNRTDFGDKTLAFFMQPWAYSEDLSLLYFGSPSINRAGKFFAELHALVPNALSMPRYLRDWTGSWRFLSADNLGTNTNGTSENGAYASMAFSTNGQFVIFTGRKAGSLGPTDPTSDQVSGNIAYGVDLSTGISDTWADRGATELLGVCTGDGTERTEIPGVVMGKLGARTCPDPLPGRDSTLIDLRGSSTGPNLSVGSDAPRQGLVSAHGDRAFFLSPDPEAKDPDGAGSIENGGNPCNGEGASTQCPTQLYLRQTEPDGSFRTRWISRTEVSLAEGAPAEQNAALLGPVYFQGASQNGDKVFFQTNSPLTADDPNGQPLSPLDPRPILTGVAGDSSWDLYQYEVPSDPDGRPSGEDPGAGTLTRISAGPLGNGDCNVVASDPIDAGSLRFLSRDGDVLYFTCAAPLPGVPAPANGTITSPAGTSTNITTVNLYMYDSRKALTDRWRFVASIPRGHDQRTVEADTVLRACASTATGDTGPFRSPGSEGNYESAQLRANCVWGADDGSFVSFMTLAPLTADDPDAASGDIYAFDADADQLTRITAAQGGSGGTYPCVTARSGTLPPDEQIHCHGDPGYTGDYATTGGGKTRNRVVATAPENPSDRIAFFASRSRLIPEDTDDHNDVYQWRNGKLSLVSTGIEDTSAMYSGNDASGQDVFIITRKALTWQDIDGVRDAYDARIGGGIPQPAPPPSCAVLGGLCQGSAGPAPALATPSSAAAGGEGNVREAPAKGRKCGKRQVRRKGRCAAKRKAGSRRGAKRNRRAGR